MDKVVLSIIAVSTVLGASIPPAFSREYRGLPLYRRINRYFAAVAMWSLATIAIALGCRLQMAPSSTSIERSLLLIKAATFMLIPSIVVAVAMKMISRTPTLDELFRQEMGDDPKSNGAKPR